MPSAAPNFRANGTIQPSTIVKIDATKPGFYVIASAAKTDKPVGIAQEGSYDPPGVNGSQPDAARAGLPIRVFGQGDECLLVIGTGGCTAGDLLVSDANGNGVTETFAGSVYAATPIWVIGRALETRLAGEKGRVLIEIQAVPASV